LHGMFPEEEIISTRRDCEGKLDVISLVQDVLQEDRQ